MPRQIIRKTAKAEVVQELQDNPEVQQGLVRLQGLMPGLKDSLQCGEESYVESC